jgi:Lon-like protease
VTDATDALPESTAPPGRRRMSIRGRNAIVAGLVAALLALLAALLPVPFLIVSPGPTFNTIGDVDGVPLVVITDTETFATDGHLDMTTVREAGEPRSRISVFEALGAWMSTSRAVLPRELLYPDDITGDEVTQRNAALFSTSQSFAIAAAMAVVDRPVIATPVITAIVADSPAEGALTAGEEITAVDGQPVAGPADVDDAVRAEPIGSVLIFDVIRDGEPESIEVTSAENPQEPGQPYVGIAVGLLYSAEFGIDFTLKDVGGPSAGLMFTLAIIDKLTPESLTDGRFVAGTGTIDPQGQVGPIGGIRQKLAGARDAGAELFLMPEQHCEESQGAVPDGLTVVPVASVDQALTALAQWRNGEPTAGCPTA